MINGASLALMAGTWFAGRAFLTGREVGRTSRALTVTKDLLVGASLLSGIGAMVAGRMLDKEVAASNEPLQTGSRPSAETRARVAKLQIITNNAGRMNILMNAAVLAVTSVLAMKSGRERSLAQPLAEALADHQASAGWCSTSGSSA